MELDFFFVIRIAALFLSFGVYFFEELKFEKVSSFISTCLCFLGASLIAFSSTIVADILDYYFENLHFIFRLIIVLAVYIPLALLVVFLSSRAASFLLRQKRISKKSMDETKADRDKGKESEAERRMEPTMRSEPTPGKETIAKAKPTVFVTYAWEPKGKEIEQYAKEVKSFVDTLRGQSIDATFDLALFEQYDNWHTVMIEGLKRDKIVILLSREYKAKADRFEGRHGTGVEFESSILSQENRKDPTRVILVKPECMKGIPNEEITPICFNTGKNIIDLSESGIIGGYNRLYARIFDEKIVEPTPISGPSPVIKKI